MKEIDRQKLTQFVEHSISHEDNPESFSSQLQSEIEKCLKQNQLHLREESSRMRFQQLIKQNVAQRQKLEQTINGKLKQSQLSRKQHFQEQSKSLAELNKRKKEMQTQRLKMKQREQLKQSLAIIKQIEGKGEAYQQLRLNKSASEGRSKFVSKLRLRQQADAAEYGSIVEELKQKKRIYEMPKKKLKALYQLKVGQIRAKEESNLKLREDRLGESLSKIEKARQRKEQFLNQRVEKIEKMDKYQCELHKSKLLEIRSSEINKRKQLDKLHQSRNRESSMSNYSTKCKSGIIKNGEKIGGQIEDSSKFQYASKGRSYRKDIRECINEYLKQNG